MWYQTLLNRLINDCKEILKENLIGIYLHGSLAMGCFNPLKSDIDVLIVINKTMKENEKRLIMESIVSINKLAPEKGIEMSIVKEEYCNKFIYPTPFELHFSIMHLDWYTMNPDDYIEKMNGRDRDLAAHFSVIKNRGVVLFGKDIDDVFADIPKDAYLDSIRNDIADAEEDIVSNPVYIILNLCRVLAYVKDSKVLSKKEGGDWGLKNVCGKFYNLIMNALECYESDRKMIIDNDLAIEYCIYMKNIIGGSKLEE